MSAQTCELPFARPTPSPRLVTSKCACLAVVDFPQVCSVASGGAKVSELTGGEQTLLAPTEVCRDRRLARPTPRSPLCARRALIATREPRVSTPLRLFSSLRSRAKRT